MGGIANALGIGVVISFVTRGLSNIFRAQGFLNGLTTKLGITKASLMALVPAVAILVASIGTLVISLNTLKGALALGAEFGELEAQLTRVSAIYQETGTGFENHGEQVLQLSRQYGTSAVEIGEALEMLARSNIASADSHRVLEGALQIAKVGNIELSQAVDVMLSSLLATGRTADQTEDTVNKLVRASHLGWIEMEDFAASLANAGMVAKNTDQSFEELLAMIVMLQSVGISGSRAGTILRMTLQRLDAPSEKARKVIDALGVDIRNTNGEMKSAIEILDELQDAMDLRREAYIAEFGVDPAEELAGELLDLSQIAEDEAVMWMDIFNRRASQGINVLTGMVRDVNGEILEGAEVARYLIEDLENVSDTYAEDVTERILGQYPEVMSQIDAAWESIKYSIGAGILEAMMPVLEMALSFLNKVAAFLEQHPEIAKAIGYAVLIISALGIMAGVSGIIAAIIIGLGTIGGTFAGIIAIIGKVAVWVVGIVAAIAAVWGIIELFGDEIAEVAGWMATGFSEMWKRTKDDARRFFSELGDRWNEFVYGAVSALDTLQNRITVFFPWLWELIKSSAAAVWQAIVDKFNSDLNTIKEFWNGLIEGIKGDWDSLFARIRGWIDAIKNYLTIDIGGFFGDIFGREGGENGEESEPLMEFASGAYTVPETQLAVVHEREKILQPDAEDYSGSTAMGGGGVSIGSVTIQMTPTGNVRIDTEELFQRFVARLEEESRRARPAWA